MIPPSLSTAAKAVRMIKNGIIKTKEWVGWVRPRKVRRKSRKFLKAFLNMTIHISDITDIANGWWRGHRPVEKDSSV